MPQIAQQDYLYIPIVDMSSPTDAEKLAIRERIDRGVIFDCIIVSGAVMAKVISVLKGASISIASEDFVFPIEI